MGKRATAGTCLSALVKMAVPLLQEAERQCPRTGPGAKPKIPDWFIGVLIMTAVVRRKKSKSAQFRFLSEPEVRRQILAVTGRQRFPSRSTFFDRYRRGHRLFRAAIRVQGQTAVTEGIADSKQVAVDKSLIAAQGPPWHKQDREKGKVRAGVDQESTWSYSKHDGWVQGYGYEAVVTSTPNQIVFPLLASVDTASVSETRTCLDKIDQLPAETEMVSADSGYDTNELGERVEYNAEGKRTGRRFLCPQNPRNNKRKKTKRCSADASRARSRELRQKRQKFLKSDRGRRIYARRKKTVEPFNEWFKSLFELDTKVWHRGLANNRTQILAAIFLYQLLVRYNHRRGKRNGCVRWIMDAL